MAERPDDIDAAVQEFLRDKPPPSSPPEHRLAQREDLRWISADSPEPRGEEWAKEWYCPACDVSFGSCAEISEAEARRRLDVHLHGVLPAQPTSVWVLAWPLPEDWPRSRFHGHPTVQVFETAEDIFRFWRGDQSNVRLRWRRDKSQIVAYLRTSKAATPSGSIVWVAERFAVGPNSSQRAAVERREAGP